MMSLVKASRGVAGRIVILCLICLIVWGAGMAVSVGAAPLSGSFQVDLVMAPAHCGIDADGDSIVDPCPKVDDTVMKFEADLLLELTISGLQIGSTTVFTFKGVEFQTFTLSTTIGALSIRDTFVFAPSITEIEFTRTTNSLALRYCVSAAAPGDITPPFRDCPLPDSRLYWLIEDVGFYHTAVQNMTLARIFDAAGMLDAALTFRKKIVDLSLNIAGLTISSRALFVNLGTDGNPSFRTGIIAAVEGQTVSGVTIRAESWLGARQGLECFSECKPAERVYGGIVAPSFALQEEKLFIRNLTIAGVTFNLRAEFQLFNDPGSSCPNSGICYVEINSRARLQPLNLTVTNSLRLGPDLNPRFDYLATSLKFGDVTVTALWYFYLSGALNCGGGLPCPWEVQLAEFISTFDPPGVTITSDLKLCTGGAFTLCSGGVLKHQIYFSSTVGNFTVDGQIILVGLISNFYQLWLDIAWKAGSVEFQSSVVISAEFLNVFALRTKVRF